MIIESILVAGVIVAVFSSKKEKVEEFDTDGPLPDATSDSYCSCTSNHICRECRHNTHNG